MVGGRNELFQSNRVALKYELLNDRVVQYELSAFGRYELFAAANMMDGMAAGGCGIFVAADAAK